MEQFRFIFFPLTAIPEKNAYYTFTDFYIASHPPSMHHELTQVE